MRVFLAYAEGDDTFRDLLIKQARQAKLPAEFVYMPSKQPWVPRWKSACLERVLECHGAIVAISRRTKGAESVAAELEAIQSAGLPLLGVYMEPGAAPELLAGAKTVAWNLPGIAAFIRALEGGPLAAGGSA